MSRWETVRLGDVCEQIRGVSYKPSDLHNDLDDNSVILLRSNNIFEGTLNYDDLVYVDNSKVSNSQYLKRGDILICASSGSKNLVGKAACLEEDRKLTFGAFCKVLRTNSINHGFFKHYFFSPRYRTIISNLSAGVNINNIRTEDLDNLEISLPPHETQNQIAIVLDKCTSLIAKYKKMLERYDMLIKSRFIEMFGDPVQNPMEWEVKKLGNMCSAIMNGTTPKGGEQVYVQNGVIFLRSQNVWRNRIDLEDVAYIDEATHKSLEKSSLKKHDILMTKTGRINTENSSLGRAAIFLGEDNSANINGHVYLIRLYKNYNHEFVIRILTSPEYRDYIRSVCVGGIDKRQVNKDHIEDFPIIQPPIALQQQFAAFVQQIDKSKFEINFEVKAA